MPESMPRFMSTRRVIPRSRRGRLIAAATATVVAVIGLSAHPATAGPGHGRIPGDHQSPVVSARALEALRAHDRFSTSGLPRDFVTYLAARNTAADAVAAELALDPAAVRNAWAGAGLQHQEALLAALTQLGVPYKKNTSVPGDGFDCSGLTSFAWGRAGTDLVRQSSSQITAASPRDTRTATAGDLLQYPGHVMMYIGVGDAIVQAANPDNDVELSIVSRTVRYGDPAH